MDTHAKRVFDDARFKLSNRSPAIYPWMEPARLTIALTSTSFTVTRLPLARYK